MGGAGMDSPQQRNSRIDATLAEVLRRHPGFKLEPSTQVDSVWAGRIRRNRNGQELRMQDLEIEVRDALDASHLQLRSSTVCRDCIDLQVSAPDY